jgi:TRAP-type mannitol/chloroaromatic compound transport system permease large subunit
MNFWPLILVVVLVLINVPVSYALLISSVFYFSAFDTGLDVALIFQRLIAQCQSFALLAVPFFVTAGVIMEYAGIGETVDGFRRAVHRQNPRRFGSCKTYCSAHSWADVPARQTRTPRWKRRC